MTSWLIWQNCISVTWTRTTRERFLNSRMDVGSLEARLVECLKPEISEIFLWRSLSAASVFLSKLSVPALVM